MENKKREQAKEWCIVLQRQDYSQDMTIEFDYLIAQLDNLSIPYYATILHNQFSIVEQNEKEHYHIVIAFDKVFDKSSVLNMLAEGLGVNSDIISIDKCSSIKSQVRYLIHKDQAEKFQFDCSEIITNNIDKTTEYLNDYVEPTTTLINNWLDSGANRAELFALIGLKNYQAINGVVNSLTSTYALENRIRQLESLTTTQRNEIERLRRKLIENDISPDDLPFDLKIMQN